MKIPPSIVIVESGRSLRGDGQRRHFEAESDSALPETKKGPFVLNPFRFIHRSPRSTNGY